MESEPVSWNVNYKDAKSRVTIFLANGDRIAKDFNSRHEAASAANNFDPAESKRCGRIVLYDKDDRRIMINPDHVVMVTDETVPRTRKFLENYTLIKDGQTDPQEDAVPLGTNGAPAEDDCQEHGIVATPSLPSGTEFKPSKNPGKRGSVRGLRELLFNPDGTANSDFLDIVRSDCEKGCTDAKTLYGTLCCEGLVPGMTAEDGLRYIREAVCSGDSFAMCRYGKILLQGVYVEASPEEGARWIQRAAEKDDVDAMATLGGLYRYGIGVEQSIDDCLYWLDRAADHGDLDSLFQLCHMYMLGNDVEVDELKAFDYAKRAANTGDPASEFLLAMMYKGGVGTEESTDMALMHLRNAERKGFAEATQLIEAIESEIEDSDS